MITADMIPLNQDLQNQRAAVQETLSQITIASVTDVEVGFVGRGLNRRVAVLFRHEDFPGARFGHRLSGDDAQEYMMIWAIETGALHQMMCEPLAPDAKGIVWTNWPEDICAD